ncbi:hypothetical protein LY28_02738 [Ruminiclostridium sufflavum DSM 19573]|uniref:Uncharacterized protein n=1 Tax=Ruminiclostridium sufflavum DSM 19573 TaxID=1121337 RepID=A0A318XL48_9FIRM|nr:hypothetical protein [Ruminiclostridium sufflavum]PYG86712.1 hypothetical protein LY28_02738 [Ruminiclostridium sufflavum DSM 19573]
MKSPTLKIEEAVMVGLNCIEQGLDSKAIVKSFILKAVSQNSMPLQQSTLEELPISIFELFHSKLDIGFEIHDGKITSASIDNSEYIQSLFQLAEKGIDFGDMPDFGIIKMLRGDDKQW